MRIVTLNTCLHVLRASAGDEWAVVGGNLNATAESEVLRTVQQPPWSLCNPFGDQRKTAYPPQRQRARS